MARGMVLGRVIDATTNQALKGVEVGISNITGADANGVQVSFKVRMEKDSTGSYLTERRATNGDGVYVIAFSWDEADADNYARVIGANNSLKIRVFVIGDGQGTSSKSKSIPETDPSVPTSPRIC